MSSGKTKNYELNQWEAEDKVLMEEFNDDNDKIDKALAEKADKTALAALDRRTATLEAGALRIETGTYEGTGEAGAEHPNSLDFDFDPKLLIVCREALMGTGQGMVLLSGQTQSAGMSNASGNAMRLTVAWPEHGVTWYSGDNANSQMNYKGATYHYFALG